jgi:hypothetical protein
VDDSATIRLSPSSYDAACSALSHLFTESGISKEENESTKELWTKLGAYKKGTRRLGVKEKDKMGLSTDEGKKPLSFTAYKYLAKVLFESSKAEHVAAHTFLIIEWNLISRAEFVVNSKIDSIRCHGDAILFCMGKTKTDQEGTKNIDHPWHVYANNECAYICPVLALARHLITNPKILVGNCPLFEGSGQYDRYNHILNEIVSSDEHRNMFVALGMPPQHFGTHSIRKGAVTHISTGTTSSPPIASICLRANWAMPGVMNRYIKHENAGDQFVGKCVSGRSRLSKEFAASQAYFDFSLLTRAEKERNEKVIDCWIQWVYHFDTKARDYSKMKQVMKFVEAFGKQRGVWVEGTGGKWDGATVTTLWTSIWKDFIPYMCTKTTMQKGDGGDGDYISNHKSRTGQAAWRSIYNKLVDANKLCGNKKRRKKQ